MTTRERLVTELSALSDDDLGRVEAFISLLHSRRDAGATQALDEAKLSVLYAEVAAEDRSMAHEGMIDYSAGLKKDRLLK